VLSWLPARLTALLLALAAGGGQHRRWWTLPAEAAVTPSPNGGWPMAAMALALGVRLSKPGVYALNPDGRPPAPVDTALALRWSGRLVFTLVSGALVGAIVVVVQM
jgi:adenosylcobinamide-phosphate synthase